MEGKDPANHVLVYRGPESQIDLFGDTGTSPCWVALFHPDDRQDQIGGGAFGPGLVRRFGENNRRYF